MTLARALGWSFTSGLLALAWEIAWSRLFGFMSSSMAEGFGLMLGCYLAGLAIGAEWSRRVQARPDGGAVAAGRLVATASILAFLVAPFAAWMSAAIPAPTFFLRLAAFVPLAVSGAMFGVVFPWLCHRAVASTAGAGLRVSYLYVANIIGSGVGSLGTGFILFDHLTLAATSALLLAAGALWAEHVSGRRVAWWMRGVTVGLIVAMAPLYDDVYEKLFYRTAYRHGAAFEQVIESRHGVIALSSDGTLIGNGVYDSVVHGPWNPPVSHIRPFLVSAVHPKPSRILLVGLASGSWARVLADHPDVAKVTAVEISKGYLDLIASRPEVSPILSHPRVEVIVDDGRRDWLRDHPERQFDVIMVNAVYPWREMASNVLSVEFMRLVRARLAPGGVAFINTTGSPRVASTGLAVFPHVATFSTMIVGSDSPVTPDWARWKAVLRTYRVDGRLVFDPATAAGREALALFEAQPSHHGPQPDPQAWRWLDEAQTRAAFGGGPVTTDDNLGLEYRTMRAGLRRAD